MARTHPQSQLLPTPLTSDVFRVAQDYNTDGFDILRAIRAADGTIADFEWEYANAASVKLSGRPCLIGLRLAEAFPSIRSGPNFFSRYVGLIESGSGDSMELEYHADGVEGWFRNSAVAIGNDRIAVYYRDITERKNLENELRSVANEYRHRLKNTFAVMTALVRQSAKNASDKETLVRDISSRLRAMAAAQDILTANPDSECSIKTILTKVLSPFACEGLRLEAGPELMVSHQVVVALALGLHELATNALKYGALSVPGGVVSISWRNEDGRAVLTWEETGGPKVQRPSRGGFGTRMIEDVARQAQGGSVKLDYREEGLAVEISFEVAARVH